MFNKLKVSAFAIPILFLVHTAQAYSISGAVMLDGQVATCRSQEDVSRTAFRISAVTNVEQLPAIKIQSIICAKDKTKFIWKESSLGAESSVDTSYGIIKSKITKAALQITDFEGFIELQKTDLDTDRADQIVLLSDYVMKKSKVAISLQIYQVTTLNDNVQDEGYSGSGHFILNIK